MQREVIKSTHKFAFEMYNSLLKNQDQQQNIFYSPLSIYAVLSMTYCGARGATAEEMKNVMGLPDNADGFHETFGKIWYGIIKANCNDAVNLEIANRLWVQKGGEIESSFQNKLLEHYKADAYGVDFLHDAESARKEINTWIEEKTKEKIKDTIAEGALSAMTKLLIVNALYFNAKWKNMFVEEKTTPMPFFTLDGKSHNVDMMYQKAYFGQTKHPELDMEVLTVRYKGSTLQMIILLPNKNDGILKLEKLLYEKSLEKEYIEDFPMRDVKKIKVYLPKFKISQKNDLGEILKGLGLHKLFSPADADLSAMSKKENLFVSGVTHEAYCEVNETGTVAVAVTKSDVVAAGGGSPSVFKADHPFLFYIIDYDTEVILFSGRICRPCYD